MSPSDHQFLQTTVRLVDPILCRKGLVVRIGIIDKSIGIQNLVCRDLTSNDKGIPNNIPLTIQSERIK